MTLLLIPLVLVSGKADKYKKKLAKVEAELSSVQREIKRLGEKEESLVQEVELLDRQEELLAQNIELLQKQKAALQQDLQQVEMDMILVQNRGEDAKQKLALATRLLYITPKPDLMHAFLDFGSVYKAYRRVKFLRRMAAYERSLIQRLEQTTIRLSNLMQLKTKALGQLSITEAKLQQKNQELNRTKQKKQRMLARVQKQKDRKQKYLAQLQKSRAELKAIIAKMQKRSGKVSTMKGVKLLSPCEGTVVGKFGLLWDDKYGTKIKNSGIDISAPKGSQVKAAAGGKVAYVGWLEGYGNVVVLEHDGFYTVYSRLDRINVAEGDKVVKGSVIGKTSAQPLHFELRVGGEPVDPEKYLF